MYLRVGGCVLTSEIESARRLVRFEPLLSLRSHGRYVAVISVSWNGSMLAAFRARRKLELLRVAAPKPRKIVLVVGASVLIRRRVSIASRSGCRIATPACGDGSLRQGTLYQQRGRDSRQRLETVQRDCANRKSR